MFFREASFQGKEVGAHVDGELLYVCVEGAGSGVLMPVCFGRIFKVLTTGMLWFFRGQKGLKSLSLKGTSWLWWHPLVGYDEEEARASTKFKAALGYTFWQCVMVYSFNTSTGKERQSSRPTWFTLRVPRQLWLYKETYS